MSPAPRDSRSATAILWFMLGVIALVHLSVAAGWGFLLYVLILVTVLAWRAPRPSHR